MGASCTTIKIGKVIRPIKASDDSLQPELITIDGKKIESSYKKGSKKSKKDLDEPSIHVGTAANYGSRNNIVSTNEALEDTPNPMHITTQDNWNNISQTFEESIQKKSAQYQKGPLIGKGPSGEVYECLNLNTGELVAVKQIKLYGDIEKMQPYIRALHKENNEFRKLYHPNIIRYYDTEIYEAKDQSHLLIDIAFEYVSGGSIKALLDKFKSLEEKVVVNYTRQILEGLAYLHRMNIVHRNLKPTNILIDASGVIKLSDFGSFKFDKLSEENPQETSKVSPMRKKFPYWSAPEVVLKKSQGKPADIWSVGCVALEMLVGSPPYENLVKTNEEMIRLIASGSCPPFPSEISEQCRDFLSKAFMFKPEDRPTATELLDHPFVRGDGSPNNSYFESDTIYSSVLGKPHEYIRNSSLQPFNLKIGDMRGQNLMGNLSMSNMNASRMISRGYSGDYILTNGMMKLGSTDNIPLTKSDLHDNNDVLGASLKTPSLLKVQEVSGEDEYTPLTTDKQFFPSRPRHVWEQIYDESPNQCDVEKIKAEKRRMLEEQMMREFNQSKDEIKEAMEQDEDCDSKDNSRSKIHLKDNEFSNKYKVQDVKSRIVPIQNSLFNGLSLHMENNDNNLSKEPESSLSKKQNGMEEVLEKGFEDAKPDDLGVYWTWAGENEKESHELESAKVKETDRQYENYDKNVSIMDGTLEDAWNPEQENQDTPAQNSNRLLKSDLERMRKAQRKLTEKGHRQELDEIVDFNETHMEEVGEGEGTIYKKQKSLRFESDVPLSEEIQPRDKFPDDSSTNGLTEVKEDDEKEESPTFRRLKTGEYNYQCNET